MIHTLRLSSSKIQMIISYEIVSSKKFEYNFEMFFFLIIRSRPVARVEASTTFDVNSKLVNLDDKTCTTIRDHKKVTCATVNSCLKYNGVNLPAQIGECFLFVVSEC